MTEFGIAQPAEIAFNLPAKTVGSLRPICYGIKRSMARAAQGAFTTGTRVMAICGDTFWDELTTHPDVEKTFLNWEQAVALRCWRRLRHRAGGRLGRHVRCDDVR